ncbi:MipA/OmpV family protein [Yoonia sp. 208BN28-4]|uniref:MipA/OmpV family protein n=1 Tax=Yoonia sp. 208BN28-4 TaxID=3126505 RepID=UPI0030A30072
MKSIPLLLLGASLMATSAHAQSNGVEFTIGAGALAAPGYFGSDDYVIGPTGSFSLERLHFGSLSIGENGTSDGFGYHGGFRYIGERSSDEFSELEGLNDVDAAIELGGGLHYAADDYYLYADVRYGVIGHESLVAEVGADAYYRPTNELTLAAGPRVLIGSDDYADTYFGVTAAEAAASGFDAFDPDAGVISSGLEASATYQFNDDWGVTGTVRYDLLREDAADSPITASDEQLSVGIVLTRSVSFGF